MLDLVDRFLRLFAPHTERAPLAERALAIVRNRFSPCTICGENLEGHSFTKLASAIAGNGVQKDLELAGLITARDWKGASKYQDWNSDLSVREYYLVLCPKNSQIALIRMLSTPEIWTDDQVEASEILNQSDYETIMGIIGDRWITL